MGVLELMREVDKRHEKKNIAWFWVYDRMNLSMGGC